METAIHDLRGSPDRQDQQALLRKLRELISEAEQDLLVNQLVSVRGHFRMVSSTIHDMTAGSAAYRIQTSLGSSRERKTAVHIG
jgi:hypothetical protein